MYKNYIEVGEDKNFTTYERRKIVEDSKTQLGPDDALATYGFVFSEMSKILGKVLTLVDATMFESRQNKAFKDIVKNAFADEYGFLSEMLLDQKQIKKAADRAWENGTLKPVDIEHVIEG